MNKIKSILIVINIIVLLFISNSYLGEKEIKTDVKEPKYSSTLMYAKFMLMENKELIIAFDKSDEKKKDYDIAYVDVDLNNKLEDKEKYKVVLNMRASGEITVKIDNTEYKFELGYKNANNKKVLSLDLEIIIKDKEDVWKYQQLKRYCDLNPDINMKPSKIFEKEMVIKPEISISNGLLLRIEISMFDKYNNKYRFPGKIARNGKLIKGPLFIIEDVKGNEKFKNNFIFC